MAESPAGEIRHRTAAISSLMDHSLSPVLHRVAYAGLGLDDWSHKRHETGSEALSVLLTELTAPVQADPAQAGLSVTMPHKQTLPTRPDVIDPPAEAVGAINTVVAQRSGAGGALLADFNTDITGVIGALRETARTQAPDYPGGCLRAEQAVVFESGTTACSTLATFGELRAGRVTVAARRHANPGRALSAAHRMELDIETLTQKPSDSTSNTEAARHLATANVAISTLPVHAASPLAHPLRQALDRAEGTRPEAATLDIIYAPWPTAVIGTQAHAEGALAPGWLMLLHQAVSQVQLMTGQQPDIDLIRTALLATIAPTADTSTITH